MDAKSIEIMAVNAFTDSVITSMHLDPFIASNDKEPFFDGNVYIYDDKSKGKKSFKGRVAVQLKGKEVGNKEMGKDRISYPVDTTDLRGYLIDGGVIFIVVLVSKVARKIFYKELTPVFLKQLIDSLKEKQKTRIIDLVSFPADDDYKASIFINFLKNCEKQSVVKIDSKLKTLTELEDAGVLENITISVTGYGLSKDVEDAFLSQDTYLYAKIKGTDILQPLEGIAVEKFICRYVPIKISIGNRVFFDGCNVNRSKKGFRIKIGEGLVFDQSIKEEKSTIQFTPSKWIRKQARDLEFFLELIESRVVKIGSMEIDLDKVGFNCASYDVESAKEQLVKLQDAVKMFDSLRYDGDINISQLNTEEFRNLSRLVDAIIYHKSVNHLKDNLPPIVSLNINGKGFMVIFEKIEEKQGTYNIYDFFDKEFPLVMKVGDEEFKPISQYAILADGDLSEIANIDFDKVVDGCFVDCKEQYQMERANFVMLNFIKAYDKSRDSRFLDAAEKMQMKIDNCGPDMDYIGDIIRLINRNQIIRRKGNSISEEEQDKLYAIISNSDMDPSIQLGTAIVLNEKGLAKRAIKKLSKDQIDEMKNYPIWFLAKNWNL